MMTNDVISKYITRVDFDLKGIPPEIYIAFPESLQNEDYRNKLVEMWKCGNNRLYALAYLLGHPTIYMVFKPKSITIDYINKQIVLRSPSGFEITILPDQIEWNNPDELLQKISDFALFYAQPEGDNPKKLVAINYEPLNITANTEVAKEILESHKPIEALIRGLGYEYNKATIRVLLPRLISWFKNGYGKAVHVYQLTHPNTGKTTFGLRSETLLHYGFINEVPTLARLVLDSRYNALGLVFTHNGIIFDEFDKWSFQKERLQLLFDVLLTGMEQGKWTRGISIANINIPETTRHIPFVFLGNLGILATTPISRNEYRFYLSRLHSGAFQIDMSPFFDRIAIVDLCKTDVGITDFLTNKYLPDSILRGIHQLVQEQVKPNNETFGLKGRLEKHAQAVYDIMLALGIDINTETVSKIVQYNEGWNEIAEKLLSI